MRVRLYGLKAGALDLLVKGRETYLLSQGGTPPPACQDLGDTGWRVLPRDLLGHHARCEGSAPVGGLALQWWKTPSASRASANWIWYKAADHSPFRFMVTQPDDRLSALGWYSFSYQVRFDPLAETGLEPIVASCEQKAPAHGKEGRAALMKLIADMEHSGNRSDAAIANLMPELETVCPQQPLPGWPKQAAMTAIMTPPAFKDNARPTEVLYDGIRKMQRTRMFLPARSHFANDEALLLDGYGYSVSRTRAGRPVCSNSLPGALRPNWPETGGCTCEASLKENTALTPFGPARILVCPMTSPRVVWAWFAGDGRPMVFMETSAPGDDPEIVLTLVDYTAWKPGHQSERAAFDAPSQCRALKQFVAPPKTSHSMQSGSRRCGACHLDGAANP